MIPGPRRSRGRRRLSQATSSIGAAFSAPIRLNSQSAAAYACEAAVKMQRLSLRSACNNREVLIM